MYNMSAGCDIFRNMLNVSETWRCWSIDDIIYLLNFEYVSLILFDDSFNKITGSPILHIIYLSNF